MAAEIVNGAGGPFSITGDLAAVVTLVNNDDGTICGQSGLQAEDANDLVGENDYPVVLKSKINLNAGYPSLSVSLAQQAVEDIGGKMRALLKVGGIDSAVKVQIIDQSSMVVIGDSDQPVTNPLGRPCDGSEINCGPLADLMASSSSTAPPVVE